MLRLTITDTMTGKEEISCDGDFVAFSCAANRGDATAGGLGKSAEIEAAVSVIEGLDKFKKACLKENPDIRRALLISKIFSMFIPGYWQKEK